MASSTEIPGVCSCLRIAFYLRVIPFGTQTFTIFGNYFLSFQNSLAAGKIVTTKCEPTLADGLAVPIVGVNAFHSCKDLVDEVVEVKERDIARAIVNLIEGEKVICEGAGAISTAALIYNKMGLEGKRVVCILSGGNIDTTVLGRCLDRGRTQSYS